MITQEERRKRPAHHIVHDYANLVSSGMLMTDRVWSDRLLAMAPVNSHVWHAFYTNCRKMYEFFAYTPHEKYLRAHELIGKELPYTFQHWTWAVQKHMEGHLMHVGGDRLDNKVDWTGADDKGYLADFQNAWGVFLKNLEAEDKTIFLEEIEFKLDSEFRHCGSLGKEFLL